MNTQLRSQDLSCCFPSDIYGNIAKFLSPDQLTALFQVCTRFRDEFSKPVCWRDKAIDTAPGAVKEYPVVWSHYRKWLQVCTLFRRVFVKIDLRGALRLPECTNPFAPMTSLMHPMTPITVSKENGQQLCASIKDPDAIFYMHGLDHEDLQMWDESLGSPIFAKDDLMELKNIFAQKLLNYYSEYYLCLARDSGLEQAPGFQFTDIRQWVEGSLGYIQRRVSPGYRFAITREAVAQAPVLFILASREIQADTAFLKGLIKASPGLFFILPEECREREDVTFFCSQKPGSCLIRSEVIQ